MLTQVKDLLAGWSWEAYPIVGGYKYIVMDDQGREWGRVYEDFEGSELKPLEEAYPGRTRYQSMSKQEYIEMHRFCTSDTKPRQISRYGKKCVRDCIKRLLYTDIHPAERPTIGVKYVAAGQ